MTSVISTYICVISTFDNSEKLHSPNIWHNVLSSILRRGELKERQRSQPVNRTLCVTYLANANENKSVQSGVLRLVFPRFVPVCSETKRDTVPIMFSVRRSLTLPLKDAVIRIVVRMMLSVDNPRLSADRYYQYEI